MMQTLDEIFAEEEANRLAESRAELAKEDAAWAALPQEEKDRIMAEREASWAALEEAAAACVDEDEEEDEDEEDEE